MPAYQVALPPDVAETVAHLPPTVKRGVKAALRALAEDPDIGEPLHRELEGHFKYRVRRYRVVYRVHRVTKTLRIMAVGHRRRVYEELAAKLKEEG